MMYADRVASRAARCVHRQQQGTRPAAHVGIVVMHVRASKTCKTAASAVLHSGGSDEAIRCSRRPLQITQVHVRKGTEAEVSARHPGACMVNRCPRHLCKTHKCRLAARWKRRGALAQICCAPPTASRCCSSSRWAFALPQPLPELVHLVVPCTKIRFEPSDGSVLHTTLLLEHRTPHPQLGELRLQYQ